MPVELKDFFRIATYVLLFVNGYQCAVQVNLLLNAGAHVDAAIAFATCAGIALAAEALFRTGNAASILGFIIGWSTIHQL